MSLDDNEVLLLSTCANCGKGEEESGHLKKCGACMLVKYCSAACQKAHRSQHKKECRLRAAELHDEALFKQPPPREDCPICFLRLPSLTSGYEYNSCCGKVICTGCIHAGALVGDDHLCPFCRTPAPTTSDEVVKRSMNRIEVGDAQAIHHIGCYYAEGMHGLPQNHGKALELLHQSAELGCAKAYCNIGTTYFFDVERDEKKAKHFWELAAIGGVEHARYNLGVSELNKGNYYRALKHLMIAVEGGHNDSLDMIQQFYKDGYATKDDYAKALKAYQAYLDEIKSDDRDKAAASNEEYKYYG